MSDILVSARGLSKVFVRGLLAPGPRTVVAFSEVSLEIGRGELLGLIGESGSGKSSLARVLVGMDAPTAGKVEFEGRDIGRLPRREAGEMRRRMQMVHQDPSGALDPLMRVGQSLAEALLASRLPRRDWPMELERLLRAVHLDPGLARRWPHELSGGQRQRVVIARALASSPTFIMLDEPVSSLDVSVQAAIMDLLLELKESLGLTYLLVSHDLALVSAICDHIAVMKDGRIVEAGPAAQVMEAPAHAYTRELRDRSLPALGSP